MMVEDSHVETKLVEYRAHGPDSRINGRGTGDLLAVALTDVLSDGLSMVYSFYDPDHRHAFARHLHDPRSHRARAPHGPCLCVSRLLGADSRKMDYKGRFLPQERLLADGWTRFERS
jgi:arginine-tRNA-protein transferase